LRLGVVLNAHLPATDALAERITAFCRSTGSEARVVIADGTRLAAAARQLLADGETIVAAGGGDGTISTVGSVLVGGDATLGVLPLGTLNHFARDLRIPLTLEDAIAAITGGRVAHVDVGDVNGRFFINNSSVGLYPRLVWEREQRQRQGHPKWTAMAAAAWTVWRRYRRVTVIVNTGTDAPTPVRTPFVFVGNNPYQLSGLKFGSRPVLDTGRLQVCMAPELSASGVVRVLGATLAGRLDSFDHFVSLETASLTIDARRPRLGVSLDGEIMVLPTPLRYRIRPAALRVAVPQEGASS
jgi:diacylglycerol kinase family enzyme